MYVPDNVEALSCVNNPAKSHVFQLIPLLVPQVEGRDLFRLLFVKGCKRGWCFVL